MNIKIKAISRFWEEYLFALHKKEEQEKAKEREQKVVNYGSTKPLK